MKNYFEDLANPTLEEIKSWIQTDAEIPLQDFELLVTQEPANYFQLEKFVHNSKILFFRLSILYYIWDTIRSNFACSDKNELEKLLKLMVLSESAFFRELAAYSMDLLVNRKGFDIKLWEEKTRI